MPKNDRFKFKRDDYLLFLSLNSLELIMNLYQVLQESRKYVKMVGLGLLNSDQTDQLYSTAMYYASPPL